MLVTAFILAVVFGFISLAFLRKLFIGSCNVYELVLLVISILIAAPAIGFLHAGSLSAFLGGA